MGTQAFDAGYAVGLTLDLAQVAAAVAVSGKAVTVLTPRELGVPELVAQGLSNPDVAQRLS